MKIKELQAENFMLFSKLKLQFSENVNVICGSNSTGKTAILKLLYSIHKAYKQGASSDTKDALSGRVASKLNGVFGTDHGSVGRLVKRGSADKKAKISVTYDQEEMVDISFGSRAIKTVTCTVPEKNSSESPVNTAIYLPTKEIISSTENFASLYEDYHISFEETYYDLVKLLNRPLKKNNGDQKLQQLLSRLEEIIQGTVITRDNKFYLQADENTELEMGLVSEGYRKLSTIDYLIRNGCMNEHSILFWDEPETNMNPGMIQPVAEAIKQLASHGVQIFLTTHDYFLLQYLNMYMAYPASNPEGMDIRFISLYRDGKGNVEAESDRTIDGLSHNSIMEEFDAIYFREQGLIHDQM